VYDGKVVVSQDKNTTTYCIVEMGFGLQSKAAADQTYKCIGSNLDH